MTSKLPLYKLYKFNFISIQTIVLLFYNWAYNYNFFIYFSFSRLFLCLTAKTNNGIMKIKWNSEDLYAMLMNLFVGLVFYIIFLMLLIIGFQIILTVKSDMEIDAFWLENWVKYEKFPGMSKKDNFLRNLVSTYRKISWENFSWCKNTTSLISIVHRDLDHNNFTTQRVTCTIFYIYWHETCILSRFTINLYLTIIQTYMIEKRPSQGIFNVLFVFLSRYKIQFTVHF